MPVMPLRFGRPATVVVDSFRSLGVRPIACMHEYITNSCRPYTMHYVTRHDST